MAKLTIDNVGKTFPNGFSVLHNISLDILSGEFLTLLGPSGCGKTTLLKAIAGFHSVSNGRILIDGVDVTEQPPEKRDTAMCFQSYALFPHMTVAENILFGPRQNRLGKAECDQRLASSLRQVDLESQASKLPSALSGGQQQRVALARAIAMRPGIILFDEPLSNLDAKLREQVRFELRELQAEHGFTAVYVTHDQAEALAMSDRIVVMQGGHVRQVGTPSEIYDRPSTRFVADFIGAANILTGEVLGELLPGTWTFSTEIGQVDVACDRRPDAKRHYLCWRPEDAQLTPNGVVKNTFEVRVEAQAFQGNLTDVVVALPSSKSRFRIQTRRPLQIGSTLKVTIPPRNLTVLEPVE